MTLLTSILVTIAVTIISYSAHAPDRWYIQFLPLSWLLLVYFNRPRRYVAINAVIAGVISDLYGLMIGPMIITYILVIAVLNIVQRSILTENNARTVFILSLLSFPMAHWTHIGVYAVVYGWRAVSLSDIHLIQQIILSAPFALVVLILQILSSSKGGIKKYEQSL